MKILVIDDEENVRLIVKRIIKDMGFQDLEVFEASEGREGTKLILNENGAIDLVITDYNMSPGKNGFEVAKFVKENYPNIPVILMTANHYMEENEETRNIGIKRIILKPFNLEEFKNVICEITGEK